MRIAVQTKARKYYPARDTEYQVELDRNNSITIYKNGQMCKSFNIGDEAEYDSYNLIYTGTISRITPKAVQITAYPGTLSERRYNLSLYEFCYKNYNFDAQAIAAHNTNESYYI